MLSPIKRQLQRHPLAPCKHTLLIFDMPFVTSPFVTLKDMLGLSLSLTSVTTATVKMSRRMVGETSIFPSLTLASPTPSSPSSTRKSFENKLILLAQTCQSHKMTCRDEDMSRHKSKECRHTDLKIQHNCFNTRFGKLSNMRMQNTRTEQHLIFQFTFRNAS
jgi:hypothetical protein